MSAELISAKVGPICSTWVQCHDYEIVIHVSGEVDMSTCGELRDAIEPFLGPQQAVVLDLSMVTFMDSSCLRILVQARGSLTADGGSLVLRNPSNAARRLLTIANVEDLLDDASG